MSESIRERVIVVNKVPCTIVVKGPQISDVFMATFIRGKIREAIGNHPHIKENNQEGSMIIEMELPDNQVINVADSVRASVAEMGNFDVGHEIKLN